MLTHALDDYEQDEYNNGDFDKMVMLGVCRQFVHDGRVRAGGVGSVGKSASDKVEYWDDLSGEEMDPELVEAARKDEMDEHNKHNVYVKVPLRECWDETGKHPIGTRWVDTNKGDRDHPEYRCRLVAQEIKTDRRDDLFAATPPLEAKNMLVSIVASDVGMRGSERMKLDFIDVRRAYFHAKARRKVYVRLPKEDHEDGMCGRLVKAMYGTRDAAQNWECEYVDFMLSIGFSQGRATPCMFYHPVREVRVVVHGDDFTIGGFEDGLDWSREEISKRFEVKFRARLGGGPKDDKRVRILNRVVEWKDDF